MSRNTPELKILIVEDSQSMVETLRDYLAQMGIHHPMVARDGTEALQIFHDNRPDIILLDAILPDVDGYEIAKQIRKMEETKGGWTAIIFLTNKTQDQHLARGIDVGGDDYLLKPVSQTVLSAKVRAMQRLVEMQRTMAAEAQKLDIANKELHHLSMTDGLTGIANRRFFDEMSAREWRRCGRMQRPMSIIMIDVDYFKLFNDTYGHQVGDECLKRVAVQAALAATRAGDLAARYGGEEFAVILGETDGKGAQWVADQIRQRVNDLRMLHHPAPYRFVTVSCGVVSVVPRAGLTLEKFLQAADHALYLAKEQGRNRTVYVDFETSRAG